jgi:hypothetical protein
MLYPLSYGGNRGLVQPPFYRAGLRRQSGLLQSLQVFISRWKTG